MKNIIFFRVAWMEKYRGMDNDNVASEISWIKAHGYCHEMFNFKPYKGKFLGFVEPKGSIGIQRLDKKIHPNDEKIENVTVVWVSTAPKGGMFIVGWYLNSTIYRNEQEPPADSNRIFQEDKILYNVEAKIKDCCLLPVSKRNKRVPTGKGGIGQSNFWYADDKLNPSHQEYRNEITRYIEDIMTKK